MARIYETRIQPDLNAVPPAPDGTKTFVMVCGPMGAGKTRAADRYMDRLQNEFDAARPDFVDDETDGFVHLDMDTLREEYPGYRSLAHGVDGGLNVGAETQRQASRWFDKALISSLDEGKNVLAEGSRPNAWLLEQARSRGYHVVVASIVCSEEESRSGVLARYVQQVEETSEKLGEGRSFGRNVPVDIQKNAINQLLPDLENAKEHRLADEIHLHERFNSFSYFSTRLEIQSDGNKSWSDATPLHQPVTELRDRRWDPEYAQGMNEHIDKLADNGVVKGDGRLRKECFAIRSMAEPKIKESLGDTSMKPTALLGIHHKNRKARIKKTPDRNVNPAPRAAIDRSTTKRYPGLST
ncbi:zeta toxin family protein [Nocardiopsis rhodophaea]|uniref:zeta toxin family protein n=1 Tax=Nocardiopsis rhodophaea TaxID=280238 RepID=UPI0031D6E76C